MRPERYRPPSAPATKFAYNNRRWLRVRNKKLGRAPLCEMCLMHGDRTPATLAHHIVPISQGGAPYALENLESLCHACHAKRHAPVK